MRKQLIIVAAVAAALSVPSLASAKSLPYDTGYTCTGCVPSSPDYDVTPFGTTGFQISDAVTSGSFGDWLFSPAVAPAGRPGSFTASFTIAAADGARNTPGPDGQWNHISVSPDNGSGARMSYLRFENQPDGIHVLFDDVVDPGRVIGGDTFREFDIATLSASASHQVQLALDLKAGYATDTVKVYIDGKLARTGTSWKDYYLFDGESGFGKVPPTNCLIFQARGEAWLGDRGKGFVIDNVSLSSTT